MRGIFNPKDMPFAKQTPVSNDPANPGPCVTAIPLNSDLFTAEVVIAF